MAQPALLAIQDQKGPTFGGVVFRPECWVLDAQPFVMQRARRIFLNAQAFYGFSGQHTHRPISLPKTPDAAKDLLWLCERYPLYIDAPSYAEILRLSHQYDAAILAASNADQDALFELSGHALVPAFPLRDHQIKFRNLARASKGILLADPIGGGKTFSACSLTLEPDERPALCVVPAHLTVQWKSKAEELLPSCKVHIIRGTKPYRLPPADIYVTAYTRLKGWQDVLVPMALPTVIYDEVQDLRHTGTAKRDAARAVSARANVRAGLSATPNYNMGGEIWSVLDAICPDCLGPEAEFKREWCTGDKVNDPLALNTYLKSRGLMLRRTQEECGMHTGEPNKQIITLEGDLDTLRQIQDVAKSLAMSVLSCKVGESDKASRELDWKLRQATGIAKAKPVAEFVKMLCDSGEKVLLAGWHRDVYDIWLRELRGYNPVMNTGSESPKQKSDAKERFVKGDSQVLIMSLRSGAGIDGLQEACSIAVIGELDWSPHVMDQLIGRLNREGQTRPVMAYYPVVEDGSDPFMMGILGVKRDQHEGVVEGKKTEAEVVENGAAHMDRVREMAAAYLLSIGESVPDTVTPTGLLAKVQDAVSRLKVPCSSEKAMQDAIFDLLPGLLSEKVEREVPIGKRGRLDFLVSDDSERVAIECKLTQSGRASVYRQVRKYAEDGGITGLVIFAPWSGVSSFSVDGVPVCVVDWSRRLI